MRVCVCNVGYKHDYIFAGYAAMVPLASRRIKVTCVATIDQVPGWVARDELGSNKTGPRTAATKKIMTLNSVLKAISEKLGIDTKLVHHPTLVSDTTHTPLPYSCEHTYVQIYFYF